MLKVLIADDYAIVRRGVKEILERQLDGVVCGEAENGEQALAEAQSGDWDLVILDITMPGRDGVDVLKELKRSKPTLPVLILSMHPEDQSGKRVLRAGASGYMRKESAPEELIKAVRKVVTGGRYVSADLGEALAADLSEGGDSRAHESLSDRELEVLRKIAEGKSVGQIAEELQLGVPTISTYRSRILEKMKLSTTAELMLYAVRNRLVD